MKQSNLQRNKKKQTDKKEKDLISDIEILEKSDRIYSTDLLEDKKRELEKIRDTKMKGSIIRSTVQWHNEGEKPTRFFCSLESHNYIEKTIKRIDNQNRIITNQKEILGELGKFYEKLFKSNDYILFYFIYLL